MQQLFAIEKKEWKPEVQRYKEFYGTFEIDKIPEALKKELTTLEEKIDKL